MKKTKKTRTTRMPILRAYFGKRKIHVDLFAGGGGASVGAAMATGESPDIAVNHSPVAIAMHRANHPTTKHYIENVYAVDPRRATGGQPVGLLWMSPTCTDFSKAKGAPLSAESVKIRGLAWSVLPWIKHARPEVIILENVEEFEKWGPLHHTHSAGCSKERAKKNAERWARAKPAQRAHFNFGPTGCLRDCHYCTRVEEREGDTFKAFVKKIRSKGYWVDWRVLRACDYGAPTTRKRLYMIMTADGKPRPWPTPTHGPSPGLLPHRTAAECIDWTLPCPSIFDREKPLADKTMARIARGVQKYVLDNPNPFVVPATDDGMIAVPYMVHRSNGERPGQDPRTYDIGKPHPTVVAEGQKTALCLAFLNKHNGGHESTTGGQTVTRPIDAISAQDSKAVTVAHVVKLRGTSEAHLNSCSSPADAPLPTVSASGTHLAEVRAFLVRYNGQSGPQPVDQPIGTLDTTDRYGMVLVKLGGELYEVVDIGMRMLTPAELFAAQGFPKEYVINPVGPKNKPLTKTEQIRAVGNSVCPPVAKALVEAVTA